MENKNVYSVQFGRNGTDKGDGFYYRKKDREFMEKACDRIFEMDGRRDMDG